MLAWLHQAIASEKESIHSLLKHTDSSCKYISQTAYRLGQFLSLWGNIFPVRTSQPLNNMGIAIDLYHKWRVLHGNEARMFF